MAASAPASSVDFLNLVRQCGILPPERLETLPDADALPSEPSRAAAVLVQKGFLTRFQASQLLTGRHKGFRIGPYVIHDLLGRGGMGAVYLGVHVDLRRKVAIKVLAPGKREDQHLSVERFLREARAAAALDHPNIVRIHDVARQNDVPYLVMEYIEGETLQQTLDRDGRVSHGVAAEYIAQAAAGLQHAHEKGFVHRDIKPGNLIRDRSGVVKLLDMGLTRSASDGDKLTEQFDEGAVVGTADFISPEQAINSPDVDCRADIYSLGATLYTLVVGKTPFEGNTTQKLMQHQLREPPPLSALNMAVPEELSEVVGRMLAKKPSDRYQTAAEVIAALAPWAADSARVLAGMSRTRLGGGDSQAALSERLNRNSRRLTSKPLSDSSVDPSDVKKSTKVLASSPTVRDRQQPAPEEDSDEAPARTKNRTPLFIGIGAAVVAVGTLGVWLALGGGKESPVRAEVSNPAQQGPQQGPPRPNSNPSPKAAPKNPAGPPAPIAGPKDPHPADPVRFATTFSDLKPFVIRSGLTVDPGDPNKKTYLPISQTGPGVLPAGWTARCWNKDTEMEAFGDTSEGRHALGIRNVRGPGSAMLFTPRFDCPSGVVRLRIEYAAGVRNGAFNVRFKADDQRGAWDVLKPATAGGAWRTEELLVDLKGASGGVFEFHNNETAPSGGVVIRSVVVTEPSPDRADRVVFKFDAADLPGFHNTKIGRQKTGGDDDPRVQGVYFGGWKADTESEWACAPVQGAKALGITNLSDVLSAQIGIELENVIGAKFEPGQLVRMRVTYRTSGKGHGRIYFQTADDYKVPDSADLPNSNDDWRTVELITTRKNSPLRCLVDTSEKGEGNTLYVRTVTVAVIGDARPGGVSVAPPAPAPAPPAPANALDPATWAEGATVYALDVSKIPAFRTQKERGKRLGGDTEQLPPGIGCQCWKDGAVSEFRRDTIDGAPALGVTNFNDEKSGQYFFAFEGGMKVALQPGKGYRVKIGYRAANDATGSATVNMVPGYKSIATTKMGSPGDQWKTATVSFVRPPAEDKVEVRMGIDNTAVGEGNTLWIRSLEIVELVPPKG